MGTFCSVCSACARIHDTYLKIAYQEKMGGSGLSFTPSPALGAGVGWGGVGVFISLLKRCHCGNTFIL